MNGKSQSLAAIQDSMMNAVRSCFSERELEDLRVVIRITMELHEHLATKDLTNYESATVFSGIESFVSLVHAYAVLRGSETHTRLEWKAVSMSSLKHEFETIYARFIEKEAFEERCRLLLDLYKLQIGLAAMTYDCLDD
jgi:hypothetical protein